MSDTFGKFKDSLNRSIASIGAKASNSVEKSRLKSQLEIFNKEAEAMMLELGRQTYIIWKNEKEDYSTIAPQCEAIKLKYDDIQSTMNELKAIEERERLASQPAPVPTTVYVQPQPQPQPVVPVQQNVVPVVSTPVAVPVAPVEFVAPVVAEPVTQVEPVSVPVADNPGCVCPSCGASFDTEINFCRLCGTKIKQ